ncbi:MAG TPA: cytochrome C, partial [Cupriavidus sp.]|nr:cytochrome C [Cupriavidus sp.]
MVVLGAAATAAQAQDKGNVDAAKDKVAMCIG